MQSIIWKKNNRNGFVYNYNLLNCYSSNVFKTSVSFKHLSSLILFLLKLFDFYLSLAYSFLNPFLHILPGNIDNKILKIIKKPILIKPLVMVETKKVVLQPFSPLFSYYGFSRNSFRRRSSRKIILFWYVLSISIYK